MQHMLQNMMHEARMVSVIKGHCQHEGTIYCREELSCMGCIYCRVCSTESIARFLSAQDAGKVLHLLLVVQAMPGGPAVQVC